MITVYYQEKAVISLNIEYSIFYEKDGMDYREDLSVPPFKTLESVLALKFGGPVLLVPNSLQKQLEDYRNNPDNWPSEDDSTCPCCGK